MKQTIRCVFCWCLHIYYKSTEQLGENELLCFGNMRENRKVGNSCLANAKRGEGDVNNCQYNKGCNDQRIAELPRGHVYDF